MERVGEQENKTKQEYFVFLFVSFSGLGKLDLCVAKFKDGLD